MRGFAFVQFKTVAGAARAINALNLKEIKGQRDTSYFCYARNTVQCWHLEKAFKMLSVSFTGRQVAVDWAVPKDRFLATQQSSSAGNCNVKNVSRKHPVIPHSH